MIVPRYYLRVLWVVKKLTNTGYAVTFFRQGKLAAGLFFWWVDAIICGCYWWLKS